MKELIAAIGVVFVVIIYFGLVPMIGDRIGGGGPVTATGTLSFTGGTVTDGETVTIGDTTLEFDPAGNGVSGSNLDVVIADTSPAAASTALANAINNDATLSALVTAVRSP